MWRCACIRRRYAHDSLGSKLSFEGLSENDAMRYPATTVVEAVAVELSSKTATNLIT